MSTGSAIYCYECVNNCNLHVQCIVNAHLQDCGMHGILFIIGPFLLHHSNFATLTKLLWHGICFDYCSSVWYTHSFNLCKLNILKLLYIYRSGFLNALLLFSIEVFSFSYHILKYKLGFLYFKKSMIIVCVLLALFFTISKLLPCPPILTIFNNFMLLILLTQSF